MRRSASFDTAAAVDRPATAAVPGYELRQVVSVTKEETTRRWSIRFDCGHVVWFAIEPKCGDKRYCAVCLDDFIARRRVVETIDPETSADLMRAEGEGMVLRDLGEVAGEGAC